MEEDREVVKEDLYGGRIAWLDVNDMGFLCFKRDAAASQTIAMAIGRKQLANLVNPERQPCVVFSEISKFVFKKLGFNFAF
jgi:hypothetical protein